MRPSVTFMTEELQKPNSSLTVFDLNRRDHKSRLHTLLDIQLGNLKTNKQSKNNLFIWQTRLTMSGRWLAIFWTSVGSWTS